MFAELIHTSTVDGLRLDGALLAPPVGVSPSLAIDAAICLPGVSSNFYGSTMLTDLAQPLLAAGTAVLWANTRGHDLAYTATTPGGIRRQGAAYEIVDECRLDLTAWCAWLGRRGFQRIGLIGHSLGAIKAAYAAANVPGLPVTRVVAISPPRLCYSELLAANIASFQEALALAQEHVAAGRGQTLIESRFPFPLMIAAASFIDKYGPQERYDLARFAAALPCPSLFIYGADELLRGGEAFNGVDKFISSLAPQASSPLEVKVIPLANHFYSGQRDELGKIMAVWLADSLG